MSEKPFAAGMATCPGCDSKYFKDALWKKVCLSCYLRSPGKRRTAEPVPVAAAGVAIEPAMLRRLLQLAHPDRHNNSEASNIATKFLLALRSEARQ